MSCANQEHSLLESVLSFHPRSSGVLTQAWQHVPLLYELTCQPLHFFLLFSLLLLCQCASALASPCVCVCVCVHTHVYALMCVHMFECVEVHVCVLVFTFCLHVEAYDCLMLASS